MRMLLTFVGTTILGAALAGAADARPRGYIDQIVAAVGAANAPRPVEVPASGSIEVAFSPSGGAQDLVVKTIDSARQQIRVMAYSFTSAPVTSALLRARRRGVDVALIVDHQSNVANGNGAKSRAALGALVASGAAVRTTDAFAIAHDKVLIVDGQHVQTGSFNYSDAAERRNSENVIVHWSSPALAGVYLQHWMRNWNTGRDYVPGYGR